MVYKRKRSYKRPNRRPRKMMKRRALRSASKRSAFLQVKRTIWLENWQPSTVATNNFWRYYVGTLSTLGAAANDFGALFDQYRIKAIKWTFRPRFDSFGGNDTVDTTAPGVTNQQGTRAAVIIDPFSTVAPSGTYTSTNFNTFIENGSVRFYEGNKPFSIYVKPYTTTTAGSAGTATARYIKSPWLNTQSASSVSHAGFHVFMQDNNFAGTFGNSYDVFCTYYMQFKSLR